MSIVRTACTLAGAAAFAHSAVAQRWEVALPFAELDGEEALMWMAQADVRPDVRVFEAPVGRTMAFMAHEIGHERVVKGAPYCADALHESIQPLADGNRIVRKQTTRLCRDGEGRTRQEVQSDGHKRVYLRDPVAREAWLLDPERKTARRLYGGEDRFEMPMAADSAAWRDYADRMREWARAFGERMRTMPHAPMPSPPAAPAAPPTPGAPAVPPAGPVSWSTARPVVIVSGEPAQRLAAAAGDAPDTRSVDVEVLRLPPRDGEGPHGLPPLPDAGPMLPLSLAQRLPALAPRGPGVLTPLGSRDLEGLRVDGERTTWTIEAGRLGNEKPIIITREVWTSPELLLTVQSRDVDPRSGETHYRLSHVRRGEPDPALMKPPADYDMRRGGPPRAPQPGASGRG
jgi:hypothetical protein